MATSILQTQASQTRLGYVHLAEQRIANDMDGSITELIKTAKIKDTQKIQQESTSSVTVQVNPGPTLKDRADFYSSISDNSDAPYGPQDTVEYKTVDKGYEVQAELVYNKPQGIKFNSNQIAFRELGNVDLVNGGLIGGTLLWDAVGIPEKEYSKLTEQYIQTFLGLQVLKSLSKIYKLTKPVKAQDGSNLTELRISRRMNSNVNRTTGLTWAKILDAQYELVTDLGCAKGDLRLLLTYGQINELWLDMAKYFSFNANSANGVNLLNTNQVNPMLQTKVATHQVADIERNLGGKVLMIHPQVEMLLAKEQAKNLPSTTNPSYLNYTDSAQLADTDDVSGYVTSGNDIQKCYFLFGGSDLNDILTLYPTNWSNFTSYSTNPGYLEMELLNSLFFFRRYTKTPDQTGELGPMHYANVFGKFYMVREDTRNIIEIHSIAPAARTGINTNRSRIIATDNKGI